MGHVWRLVDPRFAADLEGSGNRIHGARWNSPGRGVLYTSENLSLCVLETLVHLPGALRVKLPPRLALRIEYPDDAEVLELRALPDIARAAKCRDTGDRWLEAGAALILKAPSIVVPQEANLMFNPAHPRMREVRIVDSEPFQFDARIT
jgi:RES domain-containing protein